MVRVSRCHSWYTHRPFERYRVLKPPDKIIVDLWTSDTIKSTALRLTIIQQEDRMTHPIAHNPPTSRAPNVLSYLMLPNSSDIPVRVLGKQGIIKNEREKNRSPRPCSRISTERKSQGNLRSHGFHSVPGKVVLMVLIGSIARGLSTGGMGPKKWGEGKVCW